MIAISVLVGYVLASLFLFRYPTIIHKKKKLKFSSTQISHSGGAGENIANTMTAFRHSVSVGADMLEMDCVITKDGQVIVSHDASLKDICGVDGNIPDFNFKLMDFLLIVEGLTVTSKMKRSNKIFKFNGKGSKDRKFPLLEDVFKAFPNIPMITEIKLDNDDLIQKVNDLIVKHHRQDITVWGHESLSANNKIYGKNPNIQTFFSLKKVGIMLVLFYTGLLPFIPLRESVLTVIMPKSARKYTIDGNEQSQPPVKQGAKSAGAIVGENIGPISNKKRWILRLLDPLLMRPALFRHLERRGIPTYIHVLNKDKDYERAFKMPIAGVMTDFPTKLKKFLDKNPQILPRDHN